VARRDAREHHRPGPGGLRAAPDGPRHARGDRARRQPRCARPGR
jgi:hypothetical protein